VLAPNGQVLGAAKVTLQSRPVTTSGQPLAADWAAVDHGTTTADGAFAFSGLTSQAAMQYRAVFSGDPSGAIVSASRTVTVRAVLTLAQPDRRVPRGHQVRFHGTLAPSLHGQTVTVSLDGPGRHHQQVRATVSVSGTWTASVRAPQKTGTWKAVAVWHGNHVLLGDHSATRSFRVVR